MANSNSTHTVYAGTGFCGWLTILFIGLKLGGVIDWSWWWVLSPIWIVWAIIAVVMAVVASILLAGSK